MTPTTIDLDTKRYGRLLANALPTVIKSEDENTRMLAIIEDLMAKGERNLTPEEDALLELLVDLREEVGTKRGVGDHVGHDQTCCNDADQHEQKAQPQGHR